MVTLLRTQLHVLLDPLLLVTLIIQPSAQICLLESAAEPRPITTTPKSQAGNIINGGSNISS